MEEPEDMPNRFGPTVLSKGQLETRWSLKPQLQVVAKDCLWYADATCRL